MESPISSIREEERVMGAADTRCGVHGMEYRHSVPLPPEMYEGKVPTVFLPRVHIQADIADKACWMLRDEMIAAGCSDEVAQTPGCIDLISGNTMALGYAESYPDRLQVASIAIEWAFMIDDIQDHATTIDEFDRESSLVADFIQETKPSNRQSSQHQAVQARIILALLEKDPVWGLAFVECWKIMYRVPGKCLMEDFKSLDEYLDPRLHNAGGHEDEFFKVKDISELAFCSMALWNDYCSWEKEYEAYESGRTVTLINAIAILMRTHKADITKAKEILWVEIVRMEQRYCDARDDCIRKYLPRKEIIRWFGLVELLLAGNAVWSLTTARYNKWAPIPERPTQTKGDVTQQNNLMIVSNSPWDQTFSPQPVNLSMTSSSGARNTAEASVEDKEVSSLSTKSLNIQQAQLVLEPYRYIASLPASGARDILLDALNNWFQVPAESLIKIHSIIGKLHDVSLMLDDIQDNSPARRGNAAAHLIYGVGQTINSATFLLVNSFEEVLGLSNKAAKVYTNELQRIHLGQGQDLHWTYHCKLPTITEYILQIEQKTGGPFLLASNLMKVEATANGEFSIEKLMVLLGRYYQIKDDYQDIISIDTNPEAYSDLDQGAFTLPIIHALNYQQVHGSTELISILQSGKRKGGISIDMKKLFVGRLKEYGSLEYTKDLLDAVYGELMDELAKVEEEVGVKNWILRLMFYRLKV